MAEQTNAQVALLAACQLPWGEAQLYDSEHLYLKAQDLLWWLDVQDLDESSRIQGTKHDYEIDRNG